MNEYAIDCTNVKKVFVNEEALKGVSLRVPEGSFFALLGPSGCGKTTMLRILAGLDHPDSGSISIGGKIFNDANTFRPPEKRNVALVFQDYALFPHMTVEENIGYGCKRKSDKNARVEEVLELVGMKGVKDRMPHEISGGQQQRIALARALAADPDVVLLDEPFSNLDEQMRVRIREDVRDILKQAGVTTLFVTHDQEEALSLADEVAVMFDGKIAQADKPWNLYTQPATHNVATFLGEANFIAGTLKDHIVTCELGELPCDQDVNGEVEVMFRPECVKMEACEIGTATVERFVYYGHDSLIEVRLKSGTLVRSRFMGLHNPFKEGTKVCVTLDSPVVVYPSPYGCPHFPSEFAGVGKELVFE